MKFTSFGVCLHLHLTSAFAEARCMTKKTRTILFFICVFLFLSVAPSVVFYSQGYRIDLNPPAGGKKLTQTGGLFLKIEPKQTEIYIDEKLIKKTDFFFGSTLIENLLPKKYKVAVKKEKYQNWEKTLEIKEKGVTEAKNILLIPENPNFQILIKGVKDYFFSPDERKMILKKEKDNDWYLTLFDLEKNVEIFLIEGKNFSQKKVEFLSLQWSFDSKRILLENAIGEEQKYFILELDKPSPIIPIPLNITEIPEKISFNSVNSQKIFLQKDGSLFEVDYKAKEISGPILANLVTYEISNSSIFWLDVSGFLFNSDFSGKNRNKINLEPFSVKEETEYQIFLKLPEIFLKEENILFRFDYDLKKFEKIFEPIKSLEFSKDSKKLLFFNDYEIWIYYLKDILEQPSKKTGDSQLIARFSEKIDNCFWLNNYYLIFNVGEKLKIAEIDERDRIQIWDSASFQTPEIFLNQNSKELYILSGENLYKSEKIIK